MKHYISEGRAVYEDHNHGYFSRSLAEWAISNMQTTDSNGKLIPLKAVSLEDVKGHLREANVKIGEEQLYTAWYLFNMAKADYGKSLTTDTQRAVFVGETIGDPDCCPEAVLECFVAKMCAVGKPIFWENYL